MLCICKVKHIILIFQTLLTICIMKHRIHICNIDRNHFLFFVLFYLKCLVSLISTQLLAGGVAKKQKKK
mgnify:CR=1 FL=1